MYTIVGLGNPGEEYAHSRHNVGRFFVEVFAKKYDFSGWTECHKPDMQVADGKIGKHKVVVLLPDTFMNKSGLAVKKYVTSAKKAEKLIVLYDDLDIPFGSFKISFRRGSGGHRGVESIARSIKTKDFVRVRVGISPSTPSGKLKKPKGDKKVHDFILGDFSKKETEILKKMRKKVCEAVVMTVEDGRARAMNEFN